MLEKNIAIYQGQQKLADADVNIIIDVLRAFTVSDYAFQKGAEEIVLAASEEEVFALKNENTRLSGENNGGYKIYGFDYGNSPYELSQADLTHKKLLQKTTNGVTVTLKSLNAKHVLVTGYSNAYATAMYVRSLNACVNINIIASHPSGDEDLACAEYIKALILNDYTDLKTLEESVVYRIWDSDAADKFKNKNNTDFSILDLILCSMKTRNDFVMKVNKDKQFITVIKEYFK